MWMKTKQSSRGKLQKAYHPRHSLSKHNLSLRGGEGGGYPILSWPWSTPSCPGQGVPILSWLGVSHPVLARGGTPSCSDQGTPKKDMGPVEVLGDGDWVPPEREWDQWKYDGDGVPPPPPMPGVNWQTNWKYYLPILRMRAVIRSMFSTLRKSRKYFWVMRDFVENMQIKCYLQSLATIVACER